MRYIARIATVVAVVGATWSAAPRRTSSKSGRSRHRPAPMPSTAGWGRKACRWPSTRSTRRAASRSATRPTRSNSISLDTRGDPKEATIQLKRLLEQDKAQVRFWSVPFQRVRDRAALRQAIQRQVPADGRGNAHARFRRHSPSTTSSSAPGTGMRAPMASASGWSTI